MAVQLWPRNKAAFFTMEDAILSVTEKSTPSSQQHQVNADHFFLTFVELCIRSLFHLVRLSVGIFTARFWDDWGKMWGAHGPRCGRMQTGCCTMTVRLHTPCSLWGNSWQRITWPLFPTLPSHLTPCNFYMFPNMKLRLKGWRFVSIEGSKQDRNRF